MFTTNGFAVFLCIIPCILKLRAVLIGDFLMKWLFRFTVNWSYIPSRPYIFKSTCPTSKCGGRGGGGVVGAVLDEMVLDVEWDKLFIFDLYEVFNNDIHLLY